jgi:formate hydrogenlyase subunit 3/multisubunit Na+/H+ antiporter MnhD subunit
MADMGRVLIVVGAVILVLGLLLTFGGRTLGLGRLPGDIVYRKGNFSFYFPLVTSLLLSLVLTAILAFLRR